LEPRVVEEVRGLGAVVGGGLSEPDYEVRSSEDVLGPIEEGGVQMTDDFEGIIW
jgi:hypothetical protein